MSLTPKVPQLRSTSNEKRKQDCTDCTFSSVITTVELILAVTPAEVAKLDRLIVFIKN